MSDEDVPCIGICQTDEFGYCIGCGRRGESFPEPAVSPSLPSGPSADAKAQPAAGNEQDAAGSA